MAEEVKAETKVEQAVAEPKTEAPAAETKVEAAEPKTEAPAAETKVEDSAAEPKTDTPAAETVIGEAAATPPDGEKKERKEKGDRKEKKGKGKGKGKGKSAGGYRLNVKYLPKEIATSDKLKELFAPFGAVSDAEVKLKDDGSSRGFGYVVLPSEAEGQKAIEALDGKEIGGKRLVVAVPERRPDDAKGLDKGSGKGPAQVSIQPQWPPPPVAPNTMAQAGAAAAAAHAANQAAGAAAAQQQMYAAAYMNYMMMMQQSVTQSMAMQQNMGMPQQWPGGDSSGVTAVVYEGSLKSISAKNGYGFIVCADTHKLYGRDIYIDKEILPEGAKPADRIKFTVAMNAKNHPKAVTAQFAITH